MTIRQEKVLIFTEECFRGIFSCEKTSACTDGVDSLAHLPEIYFFSHDEEEALADGSEEREGAFGRERGKLAVALRGVV